jgi:RNA polymerase sigma-70 factor (ECF subfamily)
MTANPGLHHDIARLLPRLRRFARTLTHHAADADDVVQVAVERALRRSEQWEPGTRLDSWLFRIMKNAWIDELRARGRRPEVPLDDEADDGDEPGRSHERHGTDPTPQHVARLSVQAAMARLPEAQRLAVSLVLVEGLPYKEAAEVLDVPIGTLTSRLARGREALQAMLADAPTTAAGGAP